ncbi:MAG: hypothetical protein HOG19_14365 [Gammaproteobacteria bacterium]|nr:hypothetical protein [Gammaproteobacteria bacterium]
MRPLHEIGGRIVRHKADWQRWQRLPLGQRLLREERALLTSLLAKKPGKHLFQLSIAGCEPLFDSSPIPHRIFAEIGVAGESGQRESNSSLVTAPCYLPMGNETLDAVVLHHVLEYTANPLQLLADVRRGLTADGGLFLIGFNPYSLMGLRKVITPFNRAPWVGKFQSSGALHSCLTEQAFSTEVAQYAFFSAPFNSIKSAINNSGIERFGRKYNCFLGGTYAIVARKQTMAITPLHKPQFKQRIVSFPITELPRTHADQNHN